MGDTNEFSFGVILIQKLLPDQNAAPNTVSHYGAGLEQIMDGFNPVLGVAMIVVILNLGAPLDYHLILGTGLFTAIYILARVAGKYFGAYFEASITKSPDSDRGG